MHYYAMPCLSQNEEAAVEVHPAKRQKQEPPKQVELQLTVLKTEVDDGVWYLLNMDADKASNLWFECIEKNDSYNAQVGKLTNKVIKDMTFKANI